MVRSLTLAVALALGTAVSPAHALGLGDLSSRSALNQPFDGDIELLSVGPGELDTVRVELGSLEAFSRAGVDRSYFLTKLKFEPVRTDNGKTVIRVSSDFPIREPFLNFLVEVNWPRGRLLREYTVLLDPPTRLPRRAPRVETAGASVANSRPATPVATRAATPAAAPAVATQGEYQVRAKDTLWGIASRLRPRGVTMNQMMIALQRANPQAFDNNNINRLRKGAILRIPDTQEILGITENEARSAFRAQQDQWLSGQAPQQSTAPAKAAAGTTGGAPGGVEDEGELHIATPRPKPAGEAGAGEDRGDESTVEEIRSDLLLARENAETSRLESEALRDEMNDLQRRLQDLQRLLSLKDEQLARLQDRVAGGEPVAPAQQPDPLDAVMQDAGKADRPAAFPSSESPATAGFEGQAIRLPISGQPTGVEAGGMGEASLAQADGPRWQGQQIALPISGQPAGVWSGGLREAPQPQPQPREAAVPKPQAPVPQPAADKPESPAAKPKPAPAAVPAPSPRDSDTLIPGVPPEIASLLEKYWPYLVGAGGLLLLVILLLVARRQSSDDDQDDDLEQILPVDEDSTDDLGQDMDIDNLDLSEGVGETDTSFLSEFSPSDINALRDETGEVDPVSEADVYIAYGRYQQAQELLQQSMAKDPDRLALKHKLLEVHYATRDKESFATLANHIVEAGQDMADPEAWSRAMDMGRELDPGNPVFGGGESRSLLGDSESLDNAEPGLNDIELTQLASDIDMDDGFQEPQPQADVLDSVDELSLDLDDATAAADRADDLDSGDIDSLDLDLPDLDEQLNQVLGESELPQTPRAEARREPYPQAEPFPESTPQRAQDAGAPAEPEFSGQELQEQLDQLSDLSMLNIDLGGMVPDQGDAEDGIDQLAAPLEQSVEDDLDPVSALDQPISLEEAFDEQDDDLPETMELSDMLDIGESGDEAGTKLELARAYIEMGDPDGARSILEEVGEEGSDQQKAEAVELLSKLG